ncbi:MAG: ribonuclease P protein component [Ferruginibacter sp.]
MSITKYNFPGKQRLKSRKQIEQLFKEGNQFAFFPIKVFWLPENMAETLQIAVAVSSRNFKKATDRNRIKRLMREAWRLNKEELGDVISQHKLKLSVFFLYVGKELPTYHLISEKMTLVIQKLIKINIGPAEKNI